MKKINCCHQFSLYRVPSTDYRYRHRYPVPTPRCTRYGYIDLMYRNLILNWYLGLRRHHHRAGQKPYSLDDRRDEGRPAAGHDAAAAPPPSRTSEHRLAALCFPATPLDALTVSPCLVHARVRGNPLVPGHALLDTCRPPPHRRRRSALSPAQTQESSIVRPLLSQGRLSGQRQISQGIGLPPPFSAPSSLLRRTNPKQRFLPASGSLSAQIRAAQGPPPPESIAVTPPPPTIFPSPPPRHPTCTRHVPGLLGWLASCKHASAGLPRPAAVDSLTNQ